MAPRKLSVIFQILLLVVQFPVQTSSSPLLPLENTTFPEAHHGAFNGTHHRWSSNGTHHRWDFSGTHHRRGFNGTHHRGDFNGTIHRGDFDITHHRGGFNKTHHRRDLNGTHHRGDFNGTNHRGDFDKTHHREDFNRTHHRRDFNGTHHRGDFNGTHHQQFPVHHSVAPPLNFSSPRPHLRKRQEDFVSVLGVAGLGNTTSYPRLEIRQLEKNGDQWTVFLLGLKRLQEVDQDEKLSYYQIAGIHGRPFVAYDGVRQGRGDTGGGYCTHGSSLFATWHRPYLALFEQVLYQNAQKAVAELEDGDLKNRYNTALQTLRLPYWDWAAVPPDGQGSLPYSVQRPNVDLILPNGTKTVRNPLYAYRFHPLDSDDFPDYPFSIYPSTLRDPSSRSDRNAASRNDLVSLNLDDNRASLQSRVYNILAVQDDFTSISSDREPGDSLESVHDTVHNTIGSDGHMSQLEYAGFDPIFWLHHTNVDRLLAIWQVLHPDSWVERGNSVYATFTIPQGSRTDKYTDLTPFHKNSDGDFWTSDEVRSVNTFGYTYPELMGVNSDDTSSLANKINDLYGPDAFPQERRRSSHGHIPGTATFFGQRQYITNIKARKFGPKGSFNVYIFLGEEPGDDPQQWARASSFIGMAGILSQVRGGASNHSNVDANAVVPLTAALEEKARSGELKSLGEKDVAAYLKKSLRWRIAKTDGERIFSHETPGFQVNVLWAEIEPAKSSRELPKKKNDYQKLERATG